MAIETMDNNSSCAGNRDRRVHIEGDLSCGVKVLVGTLKTTG